MEIDRGRRSRHLVSVHLGSRRIHGQRHRPRPGLQVRFGVSLLRCHRGRLLLQIGGRFRHQHLCPCVHHLRDHLRPDEHSSGRRGRVQQRRLCGHIRPRRVRSLRGRRRQQLDVHRPGRGHVLQRPDDNERHQPGAVGGLRLHDYLRKLSPIVFSRGKMDLPLR